MGCSDQTSGCGDANEFVSRQLKLPDDACHCQSVSDSSRDSKHYIVGSIQTKAGAIPQIATRLDWKDYLGAFRVRWGIGRDQYRVDPGLYAVGIPNERSDVLVTANYKLTFDTVRKNLSGMNIWLMVLDTIGVNVWCSAGKGTFGTKELVNRIQVTSLEKIVQHKRIILPQLSAVGVAAHLVKESSGFTVIYGPVRASDIPSFRDAGYKTSKEMRLVKFDWYDRLKLVQIISCIISDTSVYCCYSFLFFLESMQDGFSLRQASAHAVFLSQIIFAGYISGIVLTPVLLPYLFFRSFSFKGLFMGAIVSFAIVLGTTFENNLFILPMIFFLVSGISSFLAMNFTGASTFTSLAGVKKEMRIAVPVQIASGVIAAILVILNSIIS